MASKQSTARKPKSQPKTQQLTYKEVQRISEKLAVALEHDTENISLITLLFDYLESIQDDRVELSMAFYNIKRDLFVGTNASDDAQERFQSEAYRNKGKLLMWPSEQKGAA